MDAYAASKLLGGEGIEFCRKQISRYFSTSQLMLSIRASCDYPGETRHEQTANRSSSSPIWNRATAPPLSLRWPKTSTGRPWARTRSPATMIPNREFLAGYLRQAAQGVPPDGTQLSTENILIDGDWAIVELRSMATARDGMRFDNRYCRPCRFLGQGTIVEVRAYPFYSWLVGELFRRKPDSALGVRLSFEGEGNPSAPMEPPRSAPSYSDDSGRDSRTPRRPSPLGDPDLPAGISPHRNCLWRSRCDPSHPCCARGSYRPAAPLPPPARTPASRWSPRSWQRLRPSRRRERPAAGKVQAESSAVMTP